MNSTQFDYNKAFSRNLGWFSPEDQLKLKSKKIAIPGLGGVGSHHLHCLLRLGFTKFHIADPDTFEIQNFNRQHGSNMTSIGKSKTEIATELALQINPDCEIKAFPQGIEMDNIDAFLDGVDLVVDGLDLFVMDLRIELYEKAAQKGIPVVTAGPFGMGTAVMAFHPDIMSFNKYFDLKNPRLTVEAKIIRFLAGITPNIMHRTYLRHPDAVNLFERRLPSLNIGCFAASAALSTMVVEILLDIKNPKIRWAPKGFQVDFNLQKSKRFYIPFGNRNPIQIFRIKAYHKIFKKKEYL